jgi:hypothetical protein
MTSIGLNFYEIRIHSPRKQKAMKALDHLENDNEDLLELLHSFFMSLPNYSADVDIEEGENYKNLFKDKVTNIASRQFSGVIQTGDDGVSSDLVDGNSGKRDFTRGKHHIEMMPFYYLVDIPKGSKKAILAFQTFGVYGISGKVNTQIKDLLREIYSPKYTVKLNLIHLGGIYIDKVLKDGKLLQIEGIKYYEGGDIATAYEDHIKCSYQISPSKRGVDLNSLMKIVRKGVKEKDIHSVFHQVKEILSVELPDDVDQMKIEVGIGDRRRTIDMGDFTKFATKFDITEDVKIDKTGHPDFASIDNLAKDIVAHDIRSIVKG